MTLAFGWRYNSGLIAFHFRRLSLHLLVQRQQQVWGHERSYRHRYGLGPLLLLVAR